MSILQRSLLPLAALAVWMSGCQATTSAAKRQDSLSPEQKADLKRRADAEFADLDRVLKEHREKNPLPPPQVITFVQADPDWFLDPCRGCGVGADSLLAVAVVTALAEIAAAEQLTVDRSSIRDLGDKRYLSETETSASGQFGSLRISRKLFNRSEDTASGEEREISMQLRADAEGNQQPLLTGVKTEGERAGKPYSSTSLTLSGLFDDHAALLKWMQSLTDAGTLSFRSAYNASTGQYFVEARRMK